MQQNKHTLSHLKLSSTLKNVAKMSQQIILLSVTKLAENLAFPIASKLTGKILNPLWMFATVMAYDQAGQNTSQKESLGRPFAFVPKFHSMRYLCHSFLNWANGVQSLDYMAGVGQDSHHMNVICLHAVKEGYIINITLVWVNNEQMWPIK